MLRPGYLDDLAVFLTVAESGSMAAAARELAVDPSTVSRRVGRLEEELGISLFQRTGQGMELSEAGRRLVRRVRPAVELVELGLDEAVRAPDRLEGLVRVTAPTEIGAEFVVPVVRDFINAHPAVHVELDLGPRMLALTQREADLALRTSRPAHGDIVTRRLRGVPLAPVHAPALAPDVARTRFVAWTGGDPIVDALVEGLPGARIVLRSNDLAGLRSSCVAGVGTAVLPVPIADLHGLARLEGVDGVRGPPVWLAAPRTSVELPRVRALWDAIVVAWDALDSG